ncbi:MULTISPECIES: thiaminase II [Vitreoscilla]|uniref:Aminopyrimidine aminohydrolase n=1 Tax=Vitreoscilla stercoraria TaxID=61 RepID=A0ABY4E8U6_VITST|nr:MULTISPECIES: thiaminase II [Vitreoscilla]AUZ04528.1 thiaminase 2 [Vitreoscilla sp. C1]UOO91761.1 thiaminase II [Vitreoscilla stercoraria]
MSFTQDVWQRNHALYQATVQHPFNQELAAGTLSREAFIHYVIQDAHYLLAYGRALAVIGAKAYDADSVIQFTEAAKLAIIVERSLHDGFMADFGISKEDFEAAPLSQACHHYTSFLQATAWAESYPVALAAVLPCYWVYAQVGNDIVDQSVANNPYQKWVDTYVSDEFQDAVTKVLATIDALAEQADAATVEKMHAAYTRGAELEWVFWDSAYRCEQWPLLQDALKPA